MISAMVRKNAMEMSTAWGGITSPALKSEGRLMVSDPSRPRMVIVRGAAGGAGATGLAP